MNVIPAIRSPRPVGLTVEAFLLLKKAGAFRDFWKSELLLGELHGTLREYGKEPDGDESVQIKLRTRDYAMLDDAGLLADYAGTELIDGLVYEVSPSYREHGFVRDEIAYRLRRCLEEMGSVWHVATEQSIDLSPYSQPQPDIVLTSKPRGTGAIPSYSIGLVIEIAVNTARYDLGEKARVYAMAGIAEYWVIEVESAIVHQMWSPAGQNFAQGCKTAFAGFVESVTIDRLRINTDGMVE